MFSTAMPMAFARCISFDWCSRATHTLVTGVKRDVALLQWVPCEPGVKVTVLDVSHDANVEPLNRILEAGGRVAYFDHRAARQSFRTLRCTFIAAFSDHFAVRRALNCPQEFFR